MPSTYRIEEITFGQEGCCRKLLRAREFQLYGHMKAFEAVNRREGREFEFIKWLSPSSLEFKHFGKQYALYDLDKEVVKVKGAGNGS